MHWLRSAMSEALYTIEEMLQATGGRLQGAPTQNIRGLSIDTRSLRPDDVYIALKGDRFDGHDFIAAAFKAGAALAIVRSDKVAGLSAGSYLVVDDVEEALRGLARLRRAQSRAKIVAVTGSVGKTGTKEMLHLVLAASGRTHVSAASFNNHWGVPLSVARMPRDTEYAVFEIGMNHAGEITPLVQIVQPHAAIVTTIAPVHLEFFSGIEAIAEAKAEIFSGLQKDGVAIINADSEYASLLTRRARERNARIILFGENATADARLLRAVLSSSESHVSASICGTEITYKLGAPGRHIVQNSLSALAACAALDADLALAGLALANMKAGKGRGARMMLSCWPAGSFTLIDESYNANPASMRAALSLLKEIDPKRGGRRIAVLGDMLELGDSAKELHAGLAKAVIDAKTDLVYLAGSLMNELWQALPRGLRGAYAEQSAGLEQKLIGAIRPGDVVMVKGSLGSKMGPVVESLMTRFPPAE